MLANGKYNWVAVSTALSLPAMRKFLRSMARQRTEVSKFLARSSPISARIFTARIAALDPVANRPNDDRPIMLVIDREGITGAEVMLDRH